MLCTAKKLIGFLLTATFTFQYNILVDDIMIQITRYQGLFRMSCNFQYPFTTERNWFNTNVQICLCTMTGNKFATKTHKIIRIFETNLKPHWKVFFLASSINLFLKQEWIWYKSSISKIVLRISFIQWFYFHIHIQYTCFYFLISEI